jgi:hypothetical protein
VLKLVNPGARCGELALEVVHALTLLSMLLSLTLEIRLLSLGSAARHRDPLSVT